MELKLSVAQFLFNDEKRKHEIELIRAVDDGNIHRVKLTTNKLDIERDRRDARDIVKLKNVKLVFQMAMGGCLVLIGNLGCSFQQPFGGEFYAMRAVTEEKTDFHQVQGVATDCIFCNSPMSIDQTKSMLSALSQDSSFEFNLSQFDEFMDVFKFYKELSGELNNNATYSIRRTYQPYYFVPIDVKEIEVEEADTVVNQNGVIIGHRIPAHQYEMLSSENQDLVRELIDIEVSGDEKDMRKIRSFSDNLYLNDEDTIHDYMIRQLCSFDLVNIRKNEEDKTVILSGEKSKSGNYSYLHLYDMGQKVKLESIDNSLQLINHGASGAAAEMLEYIIGSKEMPSNPAGRKVDAQRKEQYITGLDQSQKEAFLMATDGSPVSLIKGPPGTGKTHVINAIVQYITKELHERVVISSQTHVAIDNVLDKLMSNYDLIIPNRITNRRNKYAGDEIDSTLYKTWGRSFSKHNLRSSNSILADQIARDMERFDGEKKFRYSVETSPSEFSVIGATTTTSAIGGKKGLEILDGYDWLIIDEVSKCPITEVLRYLPYVKKIIMVGDDFQLAPLLEFTKEEVKDLPSYQEDKFEKLKRLYEESVFAKTLQKAKEVGRLAMLNVNYRSTLGVLRTYNIFYDNTLINKREEVKPPKVSFTQKHSMFNEKDVFFVDVKNGKEAIEGTSRYNTEELVATAAILTDLISDTIAPETVSVSAIFPYAAQIEKFQKNYRDLINTAKSTFKSFEIDTVDAFQGRETDIVLVNTVVTDNSRRNFLNEFRRINVSMSRARDKLFIFGNPQTLAKIDMSVSEGNKRRYFADIIDDIRRYGGMIQYDGGVDYGVSSQSKIKII